jgi:CheY-like chemotaxis protein
VPAEKIMIVDDERLVRWSLRQKCEEWGYHVIEAEAGEPALKLAQREAPDLVLLDVRMPDLSGIEVLDQLKIRSLTTSKPRSSSELTTL